MRVSIRQVAKRAGVSDCTVSHVVNSHPNARVRPETRLRVLEAVAELGYHPNRLARSLGRCRTDSIGLLISGLRNPFYVDILENAETVALAAGYQVFADTAPSVAGTYVSHSKLREWPVDGILMWSRPWETLEELLGRQAKETPHVYMGCTERTDGAPSVGFDFYDGGRQAAEHLVMRGRRRIAFVTASACVFPAAGPAEPRSKAYDDVCRAAGLPAEILQVPGNEETRAAGLAMAGVIAERAVSDRPDGILCLNDIIAIGLCAGLRRAGIRIPEDIAVIGFDHIEDGQYLDTPLTTFSMAADELCGHAFRLLVRAMAGENLQGVQIVLPVHLVAGGTA